MSRKPIVPILFTLTASLPTLACSGRDASPVGTDTGQSQNALTASVPQREWLQMDVASLAGTSQSSQTQASVQATPQAPSCQPLGPSGMAILTHTIAANADSLIGGVLGTV